MMKKYGLILFLCFAALLGCAACGAGDPFAQQNAEQTRYSDEKLDQIYHEIYDNKKTLSDLEQQYIVRNNDALQVYTEDGKELKSVVLFGETKYLYFGFDVDERVQYTWIKPLSPDSAEFEQFSIGDPFKKVREFDPDGDYPFLFAGSSKFPKISYHYTADAQFIMFHYTTDTDGEYRIEKITKSSLE